MLFQTGTDEHGLKIAQAARAAGIAPRAYVDYYGYRVSGLSRTTFEISHDRFIRTTDADHIEACHDAVARARSQTGDLYLDRYEGWYSVRDEAYYDASELDRGDRRRRCRDRQASRRREPRSNGPSRRAGSSACRRIRNACSTGTTAMRPSNRRAGSTRCEAFVAGGLRDLSVSRTSFDWGVPVPGVAGSRHVRLDRRADQLFDRGRVSGGRASTPSGPPISTSSARMSCDFMRFTGPLF